VSGSGNQLGHMQVCISLQTDNHTNTHQQFFTGRMPFLSPNKQRQSTERGTERQQKVQFLPPERHLTSTKHCVCVHVSASLLCKWPDRSYFWKNTSFPMSVNTVNQRECCIYEFLTVTIPSADTDSSGHTMPLYPFSAMMLLFATGRTAGL